MASLLLGTGTTNNALIQNWKNVASQNFYVGGYVQDDWRVTSRLTLNLGLRYDLETPRTERYDRMNYFDPSAPSPLAGQVRSCPNLRGGLVFVGVDGNSRWQFETDTNNISPRIGGAFEIERQDGAPRRLRARLRPVVSAGQRHGRAVRVPDREPVGRVDRRHHAVPAAARSLSRPASVPSPGSSRRPAHRPPAAPIQAPLRDGSPTPWNRQWNVTVQRELPWRVAAEVAYVGTDGHDLQTNTEGGLNLNQLDPQYMSLGSALNQTRAEPVLRHRQQRRARRRRRSAAPSRCARIRSSPTSSRCRTPARRRSITRCR